MRQFFLIALFLLLPLSAMAAMTGTFSAVDDVSPVVSFKPQETISVTTTLSDTGTVVLEYSKFLGAGFVTARTITTSTTVTTLNDSTQTYFYRLRCTALAEAATIGYSFGEAAGQVAQSFKDSEGVDRLQIIDGGAKVPGTFQVTGNTTLGTATVGGNVSFGSSGTGYNLTLYGDTAGKYWLWDQANDQMLVVGDVKVNTDKFTVANTTGNTLIAGSLTANGGITADSGAFTVTDTTGAIHTGGDLDVDGAFSLTGAMTTASGVGVKQSATSVTEYGDGAIHKTVLTFTAVEIPLTDVPGTGQWGALLIYDMPAGNIMILGATSDIDITLVGEQWTDAAEGDFSIATAVIGGVAIDAGEANLVAKTAFTASAQVAALNAGNTDSLLVTAAGTTDANVYINVIVDDNAAHTTDSGLLTGTITLTWINTGDF